LFARYTIVRQLGAGAMGEVYLAEHPRLPRRDALKVLATRLASDQDYRLRFAR
jgi:serine/threonine protein kinase, bacterial